MSCVCIGFRHVLLKVGALLCCRQFDLSALESYPGSYHFFCQAFFLCICKIPFFRFLRGDFYKKDLKRSSLKTFLHDFVGCLSARFVIIGPYCNTAPFHVGPVRLRYCPCTTRPCGGYASGNLPVASICTFFSLNDQHWCLGLCYQPVEHIQRTGVRKVLPPESFLSLLVSAVSVWENFFLAVFMIKSANVSE